MTVVSLVSSKGGVGKTTASAILAGELASAGKKVTLVDADPNRPLDAWSQLRPLSDQIKVIVDSSAETVIDTIEEAKKEAEFVIVDLEGTATDRIGFAVVRSDLVLIPFQASLLDAIEAAKSVKLIRQMWRVANREIPYRAFLSRVSSVIRERTGRNIRQQFKQAEIPMLPVALIDRAAYRSIFSLGGTLHDLEYVDVGGLDAARENSHEFVQSVICALRGE